MLEPQFSDSFIKMLKQLNKNIKNINGIDYYYIPVKTINQLKKLFYTETENFAVNDQDENISDEIDDVGFYKPFF